MKILVVDVAAEFGGAKTVLEQCIRDSHKDKDNEYCFLLSTLRYEDSKNVVFRNYEWVKKSLFHRMLFDLFAIKKAIREFAPDLVLSLQNTSVNASDVEQHVFFQNVLFLSEEKYSIFRSKHLWFYQNIISVITKRGLKKADRIFVQAEWIKRALSEKWHIESNKISVKRPQDVQMPNIERKDDLENLLLFYPASQEIYKNHGKLLEACKDIWDNEEYGCFMELILTVDRDDIKSKDIRLIIEGNYPIRLVGRLTSEEIIDIYSKTVLIFPSLLESVGLPLIEAKSAGAYILCSDLEYAHEAIGEYDKVKYFDPRSSESISEAIREQLYLLKR